MPALRTTDAASPALLPCSWLDTCCTRTRPGSSASCVSGATGQSPLIPGTQPIRLHELLPSEPPPPSPLPRFLPVLGGEGCPPGPSPPPSSCCVSPDGPRLDQTDCPGNWTWEEGSQQTLRCQAWGNPVPELKCRRKGDDALLPIGDLRPVKREVAGTYLCQARSPRGVVTREVVVNVTCECAGV